MFRLISLRLLESYFRHRWLYLLPVVLMTILAVGSIFIAKQKYIARGVLFVQKQSLLAKLTSVTGSDISWQTAASVTVGELKELIQTDAFMRAIIKETDLETKMNGGQAIVNETLDEARRSVWVSAVGDSQVLVGSAHKNPQLTLQLVNGVIKTYLQWKINGDRSDSEAAHTFLTGLIANYKSDVDQARQNLYDYLNAHPLPIKGERPAIEQLEINRLQTELNSVQARYSSALDKDENAQLAAAQAEDNVIQSYEVIDSPQLPEKPEVSLRQIALQKSIFVFAGIILSAIGIVGGALIDRSFRFTIDVWHGVHLPVLATIPVIPLAKTEHESRRRKKDKRVQTKEQAPTAVPIEAASHMLLSKPESISDTTTHPASTETRARRRKKSKGSLARTDQTHSGELQMSSFTTSPAKSQAPVDRGKTLNIAHEDADVLSTGSTR